MIVNMVSIPLPRKSIFTYFQPVTHCKIWLLRSFIDANKVLSHVVHGTSHLLVHLDDAVADNDSKDMIVWSDKLCVVFQNAQKALATNKAITLPRPKWQMWIITDGVLRRFGLVATLFVKRAVNHYLTVF